MTKRNEVYKCEVCGNIVEVLHEAGGQLVCCNEPMKLISENTVDASKEKHVPVIEKSEDKIIVKIGSIPHPMDQDHYIEWIEIIADNQSYKKFLKPEDSPEAEFQIQANEITAKAYCNLHGMWKA